MVYKMIDLKNNTTVNENENPSGYDHGTVSDKQLATGG
jgi:hypothetical protein